ncbi:uncharacterized protein PgNI_02456 [Pyricularia grisea]|uniref:Uncharacterized protein n=1 Tax=Pyricularia grisea TaxID=148305 RepID=A0A6P8BI82_PYRGI|nr:uncharacterized protein PgNI_02456 [Pyricularia grisea]TLD16332.1 hypothetical protein PgNI_02456 [Pyricularia grisea]
MEMRIEGKLIEQNLQRVPISSDVVQEHNMHKFGDLAMPSKIRERVQTALDAERDNTFLLKRLFREKDQAKAGSKRITLLPDGHHDDGVLDPGRKDWLPRMPKRLGNKAVEAPEEE